MFNARKLFLFGKNANTIEGSSVIVGRQMGVLILEDWALLLMKQIKRTKSRDCVRRLISRTREVDGASRKKIAELSELLPKMSASKSIAAVNIKGRKIL